MKLWVKFSCCMVMYSAMQIWQIRCVFAQCGNFGDPIVKIDFGTNTPDFGEGSTSYNYVFNQNPADGSYTISKNANMNGNGWHHMADRSGNGYMMVVNADDNRAGEFYRTEVSGLCENTDFYFSAWIANVNTPYQCPGELIPPNVKMAILDASGQELVTKETGDILATANPEWNLLETTFNTGNNTELTLILINNNIGGCGNDLAIDDIQFQPCGPAIELMPDLQFSGTEVFQCEPDQALKITSDVAAGFTDPVYQWQESIDEGNTWADLENETTLALAIPQAVPGRGYRITVASGLASLANEKCRVTSQPLFVRYAGPSGHTVNQHDLTTCLNNPIELVQTAFAQAGPVRYHWENSENGNDWIKLAEKDTLSAYTASAEKTGTMYYRVVVTTICGFEIISDNFRVVILPYPQLTFYLNLTLCLNDDPISLSMGLPSAFDGEPGVYSGKGVTANQFDPAIAGVGEHRIVYSTPIDAPCFESIESTIRVVALPTIQAMPSLTILKRQSIRLQPQTDATHFRWEPAIGLDNPTVRDPLASPLETITYKLIVSNEADCTDTTSVLVTVLPDLDIPNTFTPNGDGINDTWNIAGLEDYPGLHILIVDRWGGLIYETENYTTAWDGYANARPVPVGTYYYVISASMLANPVKGSLTIIR